jgi:cyclophilin family peptidyl-prolyl cis-trans isomerase
VAKSTHEKQLERARAKRRQDSLEKRRGRSRTLVIVLIALLVLSLVGFALLGGRDTGTPVIDDAAETSPEGEDAAVDDGEELAAGERPEGACPPTPADVPEVTSQRYDEPPPMAIDEEATYTATLETTCGDVVIELDASAAPVTVNNFVFLAEEGYYDGVGFHRVIDGFMIQGGDPAGTGCGREDCLSPGGEEAFPGYNIPDELEAAEEVVGEEGVYPHGAVAMAKTAEPDTGGSQFFIVEAEDGYPLPPEYPVFGEVVEGMDVVESIALGPAAGDQAVDPVVITSVTVEAN